MVYMLPRSVVTLANPTILQFSPKNRGVERLEGIGVGIYTFRHIGLGTTTMSPRRILLRIAMARSNVLHYQICADIFMVFRMLVLLACLLGGGFLTRIIEINIPCPDFSAKLLCQVRRWIRMELPGLTVLPTLCNVDSGIPISEDKRLWNIIKVRFAHKTSRVQEAVFTSLKDSFVVLE